MSVEKTLRVRDSAGEQLLQYLLETGMIREIRRPLPVEAQREEHEPIPLEGRPGSKLIIEERR